MAYINVRKNGTFQLCIKNKLLPKTLWATFDTYDAADQYGKQLEGLLAQGIVPAALLERSSPKQETWTVQRCIAEYIRQNAIPVSDIKLLDTLAPSVAEISSASDARLGRCVGTRDEAQPEPRAIDDPAPARRAGALLRLDAAQAPGDHGAKSAAPA